MYKITSEGCIPPCATSLAEKQNYDTEHERALAFYSDTLEFSDFGVLLTPLGAALKAKDEDAAEALLDGGDDPNEADGRGMNALHRAARFLCSLPLFHRILGMIHNVNAGDNYGFTALMKAARLNHLDMVVSLMNHPGIDVNVQDSYNDCTALHQAVSYNHLAIVAQLLSDDRVDTSLISKYTGTPLKMAIDDGHDECAKILREHGAREY